MLQTITDILSRLKSALLKAAVRHPTHFPAVATALDAIDETPREEETGAEAGDDPASDDPD